MNNINQPLNSIIEVFMTDIRNSVQAEQMQKVLKNSFPVLKFNFDLENSEAPFPCGHSILRAEGETINSEEIILILNKAGFKCEVLEDKICM